MPDACSSAAQPDAALFRGARFLLLCLLSALLFGGNASAEEIRSVHVVVALCDNVNQGIVPVPARIGNGRVPADNLYWGAAYGVKTFFGRQPEWRRVAAWSNPTPQILERLVFKHTKHNVYLVADAWAGEEIKAATEAFLRYAAGRGGSRLELPGAGVSVPSGGDASLVVYIGHNGLMDFSLETTPEAFKPRKAAVFACKSRDYFAAPLEKAGADAVMLTTNFMCPEAYTTHALVEGFLAGDKPDALRDRVARAYDKYQKCGLRGARRIFGG